MRFALDRQLPTPLYHQIKTLILKDIQAGTLKPDERLPTEEELASHFAVSKITVRQALRELSGLGLIRREQGRGTFVQRPPLEQGPRELTSFTEEMRRHGRSSASQILEKGTVSASPELAAILLIASGDPVFRLRRLRLADGEPIALQTVHLPLILALGIEYEAFEAVSLYGLLRDKYRLTPARARETHTAVTVEGDEAALLRITPGSPAMAAERITQLADGRPLEYVQSLMRADRYKIVLDLTTPAGGH